MQIALALLSLLLILLGYSGRTNGLCNLENSTIARCTELEDVKFIETYGLESLKASVSESILRPGFFNNLSSIRHLDLSGGNLEQIEPGSFRELVNLRSLNLAENHIDYLELVSVEGLNHLHSLNLRKNNLRQLPPALARLKVLKHLDIQGNPLQCNCATLRVRDLIVKRRVRISKKVLCAGPSNMKGTSLFKPDAGIICNFEEQDREMQKDQAFTDSTEEFGSGDVLDKDEEEEYVEVPNTSSEAPKTLEVETPFPGIVETSMTTTAIPTTADTMTSSMSQESTTSSQETVSFTQVANSLEEGTSKEEEIFFDSLEKKEQTSTAAMTTDKKKIYKDALYYPAESSGDGEEGSGEGSGTGVIFDDWKKSDKTFKTEGKESALSGDGFFDLLFNAFWSTTEAPEEHKDPDLEEEHFIDASSTKEAVEEAVVARKINVNEAISGTDKPTSLGTTVTPIDGVEVVGDKLQDTSKLGKVKADDDSVNDELAKVSPAKQSKKGMGSYVVLAALLAVLATLIGFAAYKGDFCRKKRKRGDVERGTELKDMHKALLDTGNTTQPKIASNGTVESAPLVEDATDREDAKSPNDCQTTADISKSPNGTYNYADPVKPPRRTTTPPDNQRISESTRQDASSLQDDSLSARTSSMDHAVNDDSTMARPANTNGPPLSPNAQRVKITLQENPDSVPRTPILITRTTAGENLVKTP